MHVDGSSNIHGSGAGKILEGPIGLVLEQSLQFAFKASNNQAEYEALLEGLRLAQEVGARRVLCWTDSKIVSEQVNDHFQVKHTPREHNERADQLARLASSSRKPGQLRTTLHLDLATPSVNPVECMSVASNGQAEAANKVILTELKKRLGDSKGAWAEELIEVLWAYRCTPQSTTKETPFRLTYGTDAMIPVEVGEPSFRRIHFDEASNNLSLRPEVDVVDEVRYKARIVAEACKQRMSRRFNSTLSKRCFKEGDLVWRVQGSAKRNPREGSIGAEKVPFPTRSLLNEEASTSNLIRFWIKRDQVRIRSFDLEPQVRSSE
uniref:RNase H type-1 domain-containing protein n=1 Tax=Cajanus cajan TaxID=3821 RepID=A0A151QVC8_CAJCA|nr:hypothetical protein KK1_044874 [Cajanus cajan]